MNQMIKKALELCMNANVAAAVGGSELDGEFIGKVMDLSDDGVELLIEGKDAGYIAIEGKVISYVKYER